MSDQNFTPDLTQMVQNEQQRVQMQQPITGQVPQQPVVQQAVYQAPQQQIITNVIGDQQLARPVLPQDGIITSPASSPSSGLVINDAELVTPKENHPIPGELSEETLSNIQQYMDDVEGSDEDIMRNIEQRMALAVQPPNVDEEAFYAQQEQQEAQQPKKQEAAEEDTRSIEEIAQEREDKFNEAIVLIDKLGGGTNINFTAEEREKLQHAKTIRLNEIETVDIKKFKTKKSKTNVANILKRQPSVNTTPIVLPASGYTASVKGLSTYEIISLMQSTENPLIDSETKWSVLHSKLVNTSIGELNFNDFLRATSSTDYNMIIFGLLCATYPADDKLPVNCVNPKCGKPFEHDYNVRSLIRAEKMTDRLKEMVVRTVDASHTEETAKQAHADSLVGKVETITLPSSGYVLDLYVQSAHELIYNSVKAMSENTDDKLRQAGVMATVVKTAFIPDPDAPGEYFEIDDAAEITQVVYSLDNKDILVLSKQSELLLEDIAFDFGLMNVKCPHCGDYREEVPFDIESILFYRYQQEMNTSVE